MSTHRSEPEELFVGAEELYRHGFKAGEPSFKRGLFDHSIFVGTKGLVTGMVSAAFWILMMFDKPMVFHSKQ
jgi:hypothetical protein